MLQFILKRVLAMIPTMVGITLITFLIITCAPGDPVAMQFGGETGGGTEGGKAETTARRQDAIRAKKKLLGMMETDPRVRIWEADLRTPEPLPDGQPGRPHPLVRGERAESLGTWARALAADASRGRIFAGLADGRIVATDTSGAAIEPGFRAPPFLRSGTPARPSDPEDPVAGDAGSAVWALALSPDGSTLAAADGTGRVRLLAASDGQMRGESPATGRAVRSLAWFPGGATVASAGDDGRIRLHDGRTAAPLREFTGHALFVGAIAVSADGSALWSVGYDRKVRAWDVAAGTATVLGQVGAAGLALAVSPDGSLLAAGGEDRGITVFRTAAPGPPAQKIDGAHARPVSALAFSPDGKALVSGSKDGGLLVWRLSDWTATAQVPDSTNGEVTDVAFTGPASFATASESDRSTPLWKRYFTWLGKTVTLDFDRSFIDDEPVLDKLKSALPITLGLNVLAILVSYLVSIPIGVMCAVKRGQAFDRVTSVAVFLLWSMPSFWFATLLIQWFSSRNHWDLFPSVGLISNDHADLSYLQAMQDRFMHLVLPLTVLTYGSFAALSQYMRTSVLDAISQDYVRTARAKGLPEHLVVGKHALRNSLVTLVTLVGTMLPALIGGSVIVEQIFTIDGMGNMAFNAIKMRDYPVTMAVTTLSAVLTMTGMLVSDVLYAVVDPRISHR